VISPHLQACLSLEIEKIAKGVDFGQRHFAIWNQEQGRIPFVNQIVIDTNLCKKDGLCVEVCPAKTLAFNEEGFPEEVPESNCIFCGHCVAVCTCDALTHLGLPNEPFLPALKNPPAPALIDNFLISRRSVREFKREPVARKTLEALLDVARRAPTASNSQKLHWIVVEGGAKVRALAVEAMNCLRTAGIGRAQQEQWDGGYDFILRAAPTVIVACTPAEYAWGKQDSAIALTHLELAAEARGLGVCWAGYLTRVASLHALLRQLLAVPEGYTVQGGLMLGEPKYRYRKVPPRKPLSVQWI
jgi:nitroreductase/ferredoxin